MLEKTVLFQAISGLNCPIYEISFELTRYNKIGTENIIFSSMVKTRIVTLYCRILVPLERLAGRKKYRKYLF